MRWKTRFSRRESKLKKRYEWHEWFAWYPIVMQDEWVWFEKIYRRFHRNTMFQMGPRGREKVEYIDTMGMLKREQARKNYDGLE